MNRRSFLRGAGVVSAAAITERVFPFRTFFFPPERKYQNVCTGERTLQIHGISGVRTGDVLVEGDYKAALVGNKWAKVIDIYSTNYEEFRGSFILNERTGVYEPFCAPLNPMNLRMFTPQSQGEGFLNLVRSAEPERCVTGVDKKPDQYVALARIYKVQ